MRKIKTFLEHDQAVMRYNSKKEVKTMIVLCSIAMASSVLMSITNYLQRSWMMLGFTGGTVIIMLAAILVGNKYQKSLPLKIVFSLLFFVLFCNYAIIGGNQGFACLWMILAPYVLINAVDFKMGFLTGTGYFIFLLLFFRGPFSSYLQYDYGNMFLVRFPLLYLTNFAFAVFMGVRLRSFEYELIANQEQLERAKEQAEAASLAKGTFMSQMSHEIRTPLNAVIGYMTVAQMEKVENDKVKHCLENGELAAKHLLSIINDVLDMSSIESGKIKIASMDYNLKLQISTISSIFYNQAKNKDVNFQVNISGLSEEWVVGDQLRVNQIIMNLLSNAIKFTTEGGLVSLNITQLKKNEEKVIIEFQVQDTGIGMSEEYLSRMFTPFEQENAGIAQKYGGTGLGLAISKKLSTLMGGTISVDSKQNIGTRFTVTLPFGVSKKNEMSKNTQTVFSKLRVMVVDDQEVDQTYICELLSRLGVKTEVFSDGRKAIKRFQRRMGTEQAFDMCIIDWKMPECDGFEVAKKIRDAGGNSVPIIVATAYDRTEIDEEAKNAGVNQVIEKPLFQSSLFDLLVNTFGKYEPKGDVETLKSFDFHGARILLAEDNAMNAEIAVGILSKAGITIEVAENGEIALHKFTDSKAGTFDAILMDIQMPVMDGYEVTRQIRSSKHPQAQEIPIIAMTANAFSTDEEAAYACGMNGHLAKPVDYEKLYHTINECMNAKK